MSRELSTSFQRDNLCKHLRSCRTNSRLSQRKGATASRISLAAFPYWGLVIWKSRKALRRGLLLISNLMAAIYIVQVVIVLTLNYSLLLVAVQNHLSRSHCEEGNLDAIILFLLPYIPTGKLFLEVCIC